MNINVADTIKIVADRLSPMLPVEATDIIEIRDDQNNILWKYVEQVPQNQNLIFTTGGNTYSTNPITYTSFPTYYVDVNKKNVFYKYMSYNGTLNGVEGVVWFDGTDIYCGSWKLDRTNNTWIRQFWSNVIPNTIRGEYMFVYNGELYMVGNQWQNGYKFNTSTHTWVTQTKFVGIEGYDVWTDGTNLYYSHGNTQWVYDSENNKWLDKIWYNETGNQVTFNGRDVIKINDVYYISLGYVVYSWTGSGRFTRVESSIYSWPDDFDCVWTDGTDVYYSLFNDTTNIAKWDATQNTFVAQTWNSYPVYGDKVWSYGMHARDNHCKPIFKSNLEF